MDPFSFFLYSKRILGLLIALFMFLIAAFMVARKWIGFYSAFVLLVVILVVALVVGGPDIRESYQTIKTELVADREEEHIDHYLQEAVKEIKSDIQLEQQRIENLIEQVQDLLKIIESKEKVSPSSSADSP